MASSAMDPAANKVPNKSTAPRFRTSESLANGSAPTALTIRMAMIALSGRSKY